MFNDKPGVKQTNGRDHQGIWREISESKQVSFQGQILRFEVFSADHWLQQHSFRAGSLLSHITQPFLSLYKLQLQPESDKFYGLTSFQVANPWINVLFLLAFPPQTFLSPVLAKCMQADLGLDNTQRSKVKIYFYFPYIRICFHIIEKTYS